jgi:H+/Cl- antiporter ClcA
MACWVKYLLLLLPFLYMDRFLFHFFFFLNNLFKIFKKRESGQNYARWRLLLLVGGGLLGGHRYYREETGGRASHFQRCIGPLPYYVCCVLFFFSTLDGSVSLSSLARAGFVFTFSLSFILIREKKKKKNATDPS